MKRKLISKLLDWRESYNSKIILLTGARGVGKTYLVYDFAKSFYTESIYINFETEPYFFDFLWNIEPLQIESRLKEYFHLSEADGPVLLILDEVLSCPDLEFILKRLIQGNIRCHIICISSIRDDTLIESNAFLQLHLYPLDFEEFLVATGNEWYIEVITVHFKTDTKIPDIVHNELLTLFELYLQIGGMPGAVNEYINTNSVINVPERHRILLNSYLADIYNRKAEGDFLKISQVFNTISSQLMKDNRKFQYKLIRKGATQALYSDALQYIDNTGYGIRCCKISDEFIHHLDFHLKSNDFMPGTVNNRDSGHLNFKLYMLDTGILYTQVKTEYGQIQDKYRKGLTENYVAQCLTFNGYPLFFWESDSQAKLEFLIVKDNTLIPVEVKISNNTRSRNVSIFRMKHQNVTDSIKISTRNFEYSNHVKYVPVYAAFCI